MDLAPLDQATLLERDFELAQLADAISRACEGDGRFVMVEAAAGVGKTALLEATGARAAGHGMEVLRAAGSELERDLAYGGVRQLFEAPLARAPREDRARLLMGAAAATETLFAFSTEAAPGPNMTDAVSMLHGLYWL